MDIHGRINSWINRWISELMDEMMSEWTDEFMDDWMDGNLIAGPLPSSHAVVDPLSSHIRYRVCKSKP